MLSPEGNTVLRTDVDSQPLMRWGAIFGGWLVATGIASMLYVAGLALGFSAIDANNADAAARSVGAGTAVWMILTWTVSLFLGGMFASWFDGRTDQTMGALHGVTVWGLSIAASGLLLALGLAQAVHGGMAPTGGLQAQLSPHASQSGAQAAMCVAFLSTLLALIASGVGGWLGAGHIRRVHHLRRYEPVASGPR